MNIKSLLSSIRELDTRQYRREALKHENYQGLTRLVEELSKCQSVLRRFQERVYSERRKREPYIDIKPLKRLLP